MCGRYCQRRHRESYCRNVSERLYNAEGRCAACGWWPSQPYPLKRCVWCYMSFCPWHSFGLTCHKCPRVDLIPQWRDNHPEAAVADGQAIRFDREPRECEACRAPTAPTTRCALCTLFLCADCAHTDGAACRLKCPHMLAPIGEARTTEGRLPAGAQSWADE